MIDCINNCAAIVMVLVSFGCTQKPEETSTLTPFAVADVRFEQNATDGDVEVVFEIKGGDEGLNKLTVISPDDRNVVDFTAPDNTTMGIRQFRFESPEPKDINALKSAYPSGVYKFFGMTEAGTKFYSESNLNHKLPETISFLQPKVEEEGVSIHNLEITWSPVTNIVSYILELDQEDLGVNILVRLPASQNKFLVPEDILHTEMEYTLSIGTVTEEENRSFVETTFTTSEKK